MPVSEEIVTLRPEGDLHFCPACGYDRGFHSSFLDAQSPTGSLKVRTTNRVFRVILVCPNCGARFDIGWRIPLVDLPVHVHEAEANHTLQPRLPEPGANHESGRTNQ